MKLTKEEAIALAKKALQDLGHWDDYKIEIANFFQNGEDLSIYNGHSGWIVSFNYNEDDWHKGEVNPVLIIDDNEKIVLNVSYKKSVFGLSYDDINDKYINERLQR